MPGARFRGAADVGGTGAEWSLRVTPCDSSLSFPRAMPCYAVDVTTTASTMLSSSSGSTYRAASSATSTRRSGSDAATAGFTIFPSWVFKAAARPLLIAANESTPFAASLRQSIAWRRKIFKCDSRHPILQTASDLIEIERRLEADIQIFPRKRRMNYAEIAENQRLLPLRKCLLAPGTSAEKGLLHSERP